MNFHQIKLHASTQVRLLFAELIEKAMLMVLKGRRKVISHVALSDGVDVTGSWFFDLCAKRRVRILTGCVLYACR